MALVLCCTLGACQGLPDGTPLAELRSFTVPPESVQAIGEIRVRWVIREDASEYCQKATKTSAAAGKPRPLACAVWNTTTKDCMIITAPTTNHMIMGHEIHHCFVGHFHPN